MPGAAPRVSAEVTGTDTLSRTLGGFSRDLGHLDAPALAGARLVASAATARAPKRSGRMAASVSTVSRGNTAEVSASAPHAGPLNFGVGPRRGLRGPHNIAPTRWLTGALDPNTDRVAALYDRAVTAAAGQVRGA